MMRYLAYMVLPLLSLSLSGRPASPSVTPDACPKKSACGVFAAIRKATCEAGCPTSSDPNACKHSCLKAYNEALELCHNRPPGW
jgi:hypothetical protein